MQKEDLLKINLPDEPGVYLFKGPKGEVLYIGKATSLRDRVRSYFASDLLESRGPRLVGMLQEAETVAWEVTDSVLEALILEANLIKKHQPPYNVRDKDNKSFNYLVITKEDFPRVLVVRGRELFGGWEDADIKYLFGPFPQGGSLKEALKLVRKIFPFRDKCIPCQTWVSDVLVCKPCFNAQIGLCPGVCSGEMGKTEYARTVRHIAILFSGKKKSLMQTLEREMKACAKKEEFEKAEAARRQIAALAHIRDVALIKHDSRISSGTEGLRIEAFDIAHTAGSDTVGVMIVVHDGEVQKGEMRKFRVRSVTNNDPAALSEIVSRRLGHPEWPMPRLIVIDGGKGQVRAVQVVLADLGVEIPVVGVVKDEKHRPKQIIGAVNATRTCEKEILAANAEAHARTLAYHRARRRKRMI